MSLWFLFAAWEPTAAGVGTCYNSADFTSATDSHDTIVNTFRFSFFNLSVFNMPSSSIYLMLNTHDTVE